VASLIRFHRLPTAVGPRLNRLLSAGKGYPAPFVRLLTDGGERLGTYAASPVRYHRLPSAGEGFPATFVRLVTDGCESLYRSRSRHVPCALPSAGAASLGGEQSH
jgi:hypothetical protein